jgi:uncharacterized protein
VNEKLPSREQAVSFLLENGCSSSVIRHCNAVAELAVELAQILRRKGLDVNVRLVEAGALLHDVGRSRTHTVNHVIAGVEIARSAGLSPSLVSIIKKHVGGGITAEEAEKLRWPKDNYMPLTLEEKIVCYADKLVEGSSRVTIQVTIDQLSRSLNNGAAERVEKLHEEITGLIGDQP